MTTSSTKPLGIPPSYDDILANRVVIITGVARSGTTILGKLLGSAENVLYLYEPGILRLLPPLSNREKKEQTGKIFRGLFFEDYLLQHLHGRNLNFKENDDSHIHHYESRENIEYRWNELDGSRDAIEFIERNDPIFVVKMPNIQPNIGWLEEWLPGLEWIHIVRNGGDVVGSTLARGWFGNEYLRNHIVEMTVEESTTGIPVPWYIPPAERHDFASYSPTARAAANWRHLVDSVSADDNSSSGTRVRYESLLDDPNRVTESLLEELDLTSSKKTREHLDAVREHTASSHPSIDDQLPTKERERFLETMKSLGYDV